MSNTVTPEQKQVFKDARKTLRGMQSELNKILTDLGKPENAELMGLFSPDPYGDFYQMMLDLRRRIIEGEDKITNVEINFGMDKSPLKLEQKG